MKTTINFFIAAAILFVTTPLMANYNDSIRKTESDSLLCLEIEGRIFMNGENTDNIYKVELIENNQVIASAMKKDKKAFSFVLKKNTYYAIRIIKEGYAPKLISINTQLPNEKLEDDFFSFSFKTELLTKEEFSLLDEDTQDFPIAIVSFNKHKKAFDYSEKYTGNIKKCLLKGIAYD